MRPNRWTASSALRHRTRALRTALPKTARLHAALRCHVFAGAVLGFIVLGLLPVRAADSAPAIHVVPVEAAALTQQWSDLLQGLSAEALRAPFEEQRWLPIRKIPVVLTGEARVSRQHGLSLAYATARPSIVVIDDHGMLTRRPGGSEREIGGDGPMAEVNTAFLHVLRGDFGALAADFSLSAGREGDRWVLVCEPRDPELRRTVRQLVIEGDPQQVRRLQVQRSNTQQVEILMGTAERLAAFEPEELKRYFR